MSELVYGQVDWNDDPGIGGAKIQWMKLETGDNVVRVMGNPHKFYVSWCTNAAGQKKKFNTPISDKELMAQLEAASLPSKARWYLRVLDRSDETFKLLEIGSQIYLGIRNLTQNKRWGAVNGYDICIRKGQPSQNPLYTITPEPKEALDQKFKEPFQAFVDGVNLDKLCQPAAPDDVRQFMGWIKSSEKSESSTTSTESEEDDSFFDFKS